MPRKIVTIGGGSGHSQVLKGLKQIPDIVITGICPSTDSGGSTGVLLHSYNGNGYTGDLTKCIVALCDDETLASALLYRYGDGPLATHSVKNILFHALEQVSESDEALATMWKMCGIGDHRVMPVTKEKTQLHATLRVGNTISGETNIDTIAQNPLWNPSVHAISEIFLRPEVSASPAVLESIEEADYIVICPGDLYSSIIPTLLPHGVREAIAGSNAKIVLILNIMTKKGETDNYTADDFIESIEERLGRPADYIICNNAPVPEEALERYSLEEKVQLGSFADAEDIRLRFAPLAYATDSQKILSDHEVLQKVFADIFS